MPNRCSISVGQNGVDVYIPPIKRLLRKEIPERTTSFKWSDVTQVFLFKRDCFSVDMICMAFELNGTHTIEINENMNGWKEVVTAVPAHLQGAMLEEEWFPIVAVPAFATNWTKIYPRKELLSKTESNTADPSA